MVIKVLYGLVSVHKYHNIINICLLLYKKITKFLIFYSQIYN